MAERTSAALSDRHGDTGALRAVPADLDGLSARELVVYRKQQACPVPANHLATTVAWPRRWRACAILRRSRFGGDA